MRNEPEDETDLTIATELSESLASTVADPSRAATETGGFEECPTLFADPVEQAILLDRTRTVPGRWTATLPAPLAPLATSRDVDRMNGEGGDTVIDDGGYQPGGPVLGERAGELDAILPTERSPALPPADELVDSGVFVDPSVNLPEAPGQVPAPSHRSGSGSGVLSAVQGEDLLGNYRMVAPVAAGGMGLLYRGEHCFLGYPVAIKILQPALRGDPEAESRFFAEALATSRIGHPGVPTVLDFGHDRRGTAYLVMEFLEGETLAAHMANGVSFTLVQILEIGVQMASILSAAHGRGILHRDVKPDNMYICPDPTEPAGLRVKLLDFGVAKILAAPPMNALETQESFVVGTAWYMAPEQTFGAASVDDRVDVYSLGCVLYQLLTGRLPFCGTFEEVLEARRGYDAAPPRLHRPDIPRPVDALVARMVARSPADRPSSMIEVERELRRLLVGERMLGAAAASGARPLQTPPTGTAIAHRKGERSLVARVRGVLTRRRRMSITCGTVALVAGAVSLAVAFA